MRRLIYGVAATLDGFIAGPSGEFDWIPADPDVDFPAMHARFDTYLMGRKTYEGAKELLASSRVVVVSKTLTSAPPGTTIVRDDIVGAARALKAEPSTRDIWLFGGGMLFRTLLDAGLVDELEVAVTPILISQGIPILPPGARSPALKLKQHRIYPKSGIVMLTYEVR